MASKRPSRKLEEVQPLIETWLEDWTHYLGLASTWQITVKFVEAKKLEASDSMAETWWPAHYRHANMDFNRDCITKHGHPDIELKQTVVHELSHLVLFRLWDIAVENLNGPLQKKFTNAVEEATDLFANMALYSRVEEETPLAAAPVFTVPAFDGTGSAPLFEPTFKHSTLMVCKRPCRFLLR